VGFPEGASLLSELQEVEKEIAEEKIRQEAPTDAA